MATEGRKGRGRRPARRGPRTYSEARPGSKYRRCAFTIRGHRFRDSLGTDDVELAERRAKAIYDAAWDRLVLGIEPPAEAEPLPEIRLTDAAGTWWDKVGQYSDFGWNAQRSMLKALIAYFGPDQLLSGLDDARVADYPAWRRMHRMPRPTTRRKPAAPAPLPEPIAPRTINLELQMLDDLCDWARNRGYAVGDWSRATHKLREPEGREVFLEYDQARRLLDAIVPHARAPVMLALLTGMRKANVIRLQWESVSLDFGRLVLRQKGDRRLVVELIPEARALLEMVEPDPARRRGPVFWYGNPTADCTCPVCKGKAGRSADGKGLVGQPMRGIARSFATAKKQAGLDGIGLRFHDLRHTVASWLLAKGADLKTIQMVLGHRTIQSTARYAHLARERKVEAMSTALGRIAAPADGVQNGTNLPQLGHRDEVKEG